MQTNTLGHARTAWAVVAAEMNHSSSTLPWSVASPLTGTCAAVQATEPISWQHENATNKSQAGDEARSSASPSGPHIQPARDHYKHYEHYEHYEHS